MSKIMSRKSISSWRRKIRLVQIAAIAHLTKKINLMWRTSQSRLIARMNFKVHLSVSMVAHIKKWWLNLRHPTNLKALIAASSWLEDQNYILKTILRMFWMNNRWIRLNSPWVVNSLKRRKKLKHKVRQEMNKPLALCTSMKKSSKLTFRKINSEDKEWVVRKISIWQDLCMKARLIHKLTPITTQLKAVVIIKLAWSRRYLMRTSHLRQNSML